MPHATSNNTKVQVSTRLNDTLSKSEHSNGADHSIRLQMLSLATCEVTRNLDKCEQQSTTG